jgi:hypothetical protein
MRARGLWEVHPVTTIRALALCGVVSLFMLAAPSARAQSDGVPSLEGVWTGKATSVYWDQTNVSHANPKNKYKSKVNVTISQGALAAIELTITFAKAFPVSTGTTQTSLVLDGFVGNSHASAGEQATMSLPAVTLSGTINKKGTKLTLTGVAASTEFTHQITIKLKKTSP